MTEVTEKRTGPPSQHSGWASQTAAPAPGAGAGAEASDAAKAEGGKRGRRAKAPKAKPSKSIRDNLAADTGRAQEKLDKKGRPKKRGTLYYANPRNLAREIRMLGYEFSPRRIIITYVVIIGLMVGVGLVFKLPALWTLPLVAAGLLFAPKLVRNSYRNKFERQRFSDVNVYIEQMLYAFKNSQKILTALEDVSVLYPKDSPMRDAINEAIGVITDPNAVGAEDVAEEKALELIEARYSNDYVRSLHRFMVKVESIGGDFDSSIDLLLGNRAMWENRVHKLQDQRKERRSQILGSVFASAGLCALMLYILPNDVDISQMTMVRAVNVVMIILFTGIYLKADTKLSSDLLRSRSYEDDAKLLREYNSYVNYDAKKGMKTSLKFSVLPVAAILLGHFVFQNTWVVVAGAALLPLFLMQHRVGHALLGKRLRREISVAFPQWLMELALLLQSDNVQVAIFKTIDTALPVMRPELISMRDKLMEDPASPDPFMEFFEYFGMPEVTTSMQMLYSLSIGNGGDAEEQVANIVRRNNIILDRAEQKQNEDSLSSLYTLFMLPVLLGGVVLMVDMSAFLLTFISSMGI